MKCSICMGLFAVGVLLIALASLAGAQGPGAQGPVGSQAALGTAASASLSTSFTYQGELRTTSGPVSGTCDFQFSLWDALNGGAQVGSMQAVNGVSVVNGRFAAQLDFGSSAFSGDARWLQIAVQCSGDTAFTSLAPRQPLTPAPYALYSPRSAWSGLSGVPAGFADNVDNDTTYAAGAGLNLAGNQFSVNTTTIQARVSGPCGAGSAIRIVNANGSVTCEPVSGGGAFWSLTGNAGTMPGAHFLGTTDNISLTLIVSGTPALRLVPDPTAPSVIGGHVSNTVMGGVIGAVIGGGGEKDYPNRVTDHYSTVGGGRGNQAGDGDGYPGSRPFSTVSGGVYNIASGNVATVGGGAFNTASNNFATIGGGKGNIASGLFAAISGGYSNTVSGRCSAVSGGNNNMVTATYAFIGGGMTNTITSEYAVIGGGSINRASGDYVTIGGGYSNIVTATYATIGGGYSNTVSGMYATVGGGGQNTASDWYATVGGGKRNIASGYRSTIGGGEDNLASGFEAFVGGGDSNTASGSWATVPGGHDNIASGDLSFAAGYRAQANHQGAFVWGDSTEADIASTKENQFVIRASNGVSLSVNAGNTTAIDVGERYRDNAIVAWAKIQGGAVAGTADFGVASVQHVTGSGVYTITLDVSAFGTNHLIPIATAEVDSPPVGAANVRIVSINQIGQDQFVVYINNGNWALVDNDFVFMVTAR